MAKRGNRHQNRYRERVALIRPHVTFRFPKYDNASKNDKQKVHDLYVMLFGNGEPGLLQGGVFAPIKLAKKKDQDLLRKFSGQPTKKGLKYVYVKTVLDSDDQPVIPDIEFVENAEGDTVPEIVIGQTRQTGALFDLPALLADPRKEMDRALDSFGVLPRTTLFFVKNGGYAPGIVPGDRETVIHNALNLMRDYDQAKGGDNWRNWMLGFSIIKAPTQKVREDFRYKQKQSSERQKILQGIAKLDKAIKALKKNKQTDTRKYQGLQTKLMNALDEAAALRDEMTKPRKKETKKKPRRKHKN